MIPNQQLTLWIILYKNNLPTELIIKILYEFKGLSHPLAIQIDNGLGWDWSDKIDNFKKRTNLSKNIMFLRSLNNARYFIKNMLMGSNTVGSVTCIKCGLFLQISSDVPNILRLIYNTSYVPVFFSNMADFYDNTNIHTYFINEISYYSWCQILQDIQKRYKEKSGKMVCINCLDKGRLRYL